MQNNRIYHSGSELFAKLNALALNVTKKKRVELLQMKSEFIFI